MRKKRAKPKTAKTRSVERSNEIFHLERNMKSFTSPTQFKLLAPGRQKARIIVSIAMNHTTRLNIVNRFPSKDTKAIKEKASETMKAIDDCKNLVSCEEIGRAHV